MTCDHNLILNQLTGVQVIIQDSLMSYVFSYSGSRVWVCQWTKDTPACDKNVIRETEAKC